MPPDAARMLECATALGKELKKIKKT